MIRIMLFLGPGFGLVSDIAVLGCMLSIMNAKVTAVKTIARYDLWVPISTKN
jgi:hypothetical protein